MICIEKLSRKASESVQWISLKSKACVLGTVVGVFFRSGRGILSNLLWDFDRTEPKPQSMHEFMQQQVFCQKD